MTDIDRLLRKRTERHKLDLPEQDMCSKTNLIWLFIKDLQSLQQEDNLPKQSDKEVECMHERKKRYENDEWDKYFMCLDCLNHYQPIPVEEKCPFCWWKMWLTCQWTWEWFWCGE